MVRNYANWLAEWTSLFVDTEVHATYAIWTGIWTIASVLRANVSIARGSGFMDPHMYVFLIGPGSSGKSYSSGISIRLMRELGFIDIYSGEMSKSYMTKYLRDLALKQSVSNGLATVRPMLTFYNDELGLALGTGEKSYDMLRLMTTLYDSDFDYGTHAHQLIHVEKPVLNWLACTTIPWLRRSLPRDLIDSGFVARVIAQNEYLSDKIVPILPRMDNDKLLRLQADLASISLLNHEYTIAPDAIEVHAAWYTETRTERRSITDVILQSIYGREDEYVFKVAMCLMASAGDSPVINKTAINNAIRLVMRARKSNIELFRSLATGDKTLELKEYIKSKILSSNEPVNHSKLRHDTSYMVPDGKIFASILLTLREEEIIEITKGDTRGIYYQRKIQPEESINGTAES
jgi:hypothetical protein